MHYIRKPPYPIKLLSKPYPEKYETPTFALYDGRKGNAMEHVSKFMDSMGPFAGDRELCIREFSKSLTDRAYTWYSTLQPNSIPTWEDMVESFCTKYFHVRKRSPSSPFTIRNKSLPNGSLTSSGDLEIPPSIVIGSKIGRAHV